MKTLKLLPLAVALAAAALVAPAHAGRSCESRKATAQTIERGLALAQRTSTALDASGAQVVLLARAGQDLSKYGLHYSHLGFAYRQPDGSWRVLHKLNHCATADAAVYRQGLGEFFLDDLWRYEAAWVVPSAEVQQRLLPVLADNQRATVLHQRAYSVVSYAWGSKYQQSNQWALETLAMAMEPAARSRERAQAWLQFKGYQPTTLRLGPLTRLGGRISAANVAFDDHPDAKRFSDRIETVTVDSVFSWMESAQLSGAPVLLRLQ
jgi:hypothetical protein